MITKTQTNLETVVQVFKQDAGHWKSSQTLHQQIPDLSMQNIYAAVSDLAKNGTLEKRRLTVGTGFEYKLKRSAARAVRRVQRTKVLGAEPAQSELSLEPTITTDASLKAKADVLPVEHDLGLDLAAGTEGVQQASKDVISDEQALQALVQEPSEVPVVQIPEGVKGRINRVVWNTEEKYVIAQDVMRMQKEQPHLSVVNAVRLAQKVLPENRRRLDRIQNKHHIPWIDEMLVTVRADAARAEVKEVTPTVSQPEQTEETVRPSTAEASSMAAVFDSVDKSARMQRADAELSTGELLDLLIQRMGSAVKTLLLDLVAAKELKAGLAESSPTTTTHGASSATGAKPDAHAASHARGHTSVPLSTLQTPGTQMASATRHRAHNPEPVRLTEDGPRLKRILVLGLIPNQIQEVTSEFKDALDLRFWRTDQSSNLLKSLCKQVDNTVVMTDFIGHAHETIIKNADVPFIRQTGGISKLKDTLTTIYAND